MLPARDGIREVEPQRNRYLTRLRLRLPVDCLAVFGSRSRNDHWVDSDVDVIVVSAGFEGVPRRERIGMLLEDWDESPALEPLGYTPQELLSVDHPILLEALSDGKPIYDSGVWKKGQANIGSPSGKRILGANPGRVAREGEFE